MTQPSDTTTTSPAMQKSQNPFAGPYKQEIPPEKVLSFIPPGQTESPVEILKRHLARKGDKFTKSRKEILRAVLSTHRHFDTDWLFSFMQGKGLKVSKATVYRTIKVLCECNLCREVFQGEHGTYYEHVYGHAHHEHMICLTCGKVIEFISQEMEKDMDRACRAHGFHALRHNLQVFGYCAECHPCKGSFPPSVAFNKTNS